VSLTGAHAARLGAVAESLAERSLDALVVSAPANVRYLTGFTGSNGVALVSLERGQPRGIFYTDFRYETQACAEVPACYERWPTPPGAPPADLLVRVAESLGVGLPPDLRGEAQPASGAGGGRAVGARSDRGPEGGRLGFDEAHLTVARHGRLAELVAGSFELVRCAGLVESLREVKDGEEVALIAAAAQLADTALREVLEGGLAGRSERELAIEIELRMRRLGAEPAFPTIVASGPHGALPHATPREVAIDAGVLVTIDWGALHEGYCSDCTRTYASGPLAGRAQEVYALVLAAQEAALAALAPGRTGMAVDAVARDMIAAAGHGERFGHGLGHGVGLEVHEGPRLSRAADEEPLREGNVVTVEPGVYLPGELGVRIEDLAVVEAEGPRVLSSLPKALTTIA
jgi:Xaa-Pro aminopeptidase